MTSVSTSPALRGNAVLLVVLPLGTARDGQQQVQAVAALRTLQDLLGLAIRVLVIDEASHPAAVHSFGLTELPACVLMRQGVELWRHQGLPEEGLIATMLNKLSPY